MAAKAKDEEPKHDAEEEKPEGEVSIEGAEGEAEGGSKKKLFIIIGGVAVLLIGTGAGLYYSGLLDSVLGKTEATEEGAVAEGEHGEAAKGGHGEKKAAKGGHGAAGAEGEGAFLEIPTMIVNLNSDDGTPRYLRLTVQLEMEDPADKASVEAVIPRVIDQFQTYLRELRVRDLRGSGGIYRLQMELLWRVNQAAAPIEVKDVLFQEILIQ